MIRGPLGLCLTVSNVFTPRFPWHVSKIFYLTDQIMEKFEHRLMVTEIFC